MTDDHRTTPEFSDRSIDWSRQPVSARLRALADNELPPEQARDLRNEVDAEAIARADSFERALRRSCAACMSEGAAPAGLRERVLEAMQAEDAAADHDAAPVAAPGAAPVATEPAPVADDAPPAVISRTERSFWTQGRAFMSLAAAIAIAAVVWIAVPSGSPTPSEPAGETVTALLASAAQHARKEHNGCTIDKSHFEHKMANVSESPNQETGAQFISEEIGDLPIKLALGQAGYNLTGVGGCHLPGAGKSVHLLYEPAMPGSMPISLFIQQASQTQRETLSEGTVYIASGDTSPYVRVWRDAGAVYYMVTECPKSCKKAESAYGLPAKRVEL